MRIVIIALSFILSIRSLSAKPNNIEIVYSESADFFQIIDKASRWDHSAIHSIKKKFDKITKNDTSVMEALSSYQQIRQRNYKSSNNQGHSKLFSSNFKINDPIQAAFYSSKNLSIAFKKLIRTISKSDTHELMRIFQVLRPYILELHKGNLSIDKEVKSVASRFFKAKGMSTIRAAGAFLTSKGIATIPQAIIFVLGTEDIPVEVEFYEKIVLIRMTPKNIQNYLIPERLSSVIVKSMIKSINEKDKLKFEKLFFTVCTMKKGVEGDSFFVNPLSQALGEMTQRRGDLDYSVSLGLEPWAEIYSKLLFPLIVSYQKKRGNMFNDFSLKSAQLCKQLQKI